MVLSAHQHLESGTVGNVNPKKEQQEWYVCVHVCVRVCTCTYVCVRVRMCVYVYIFVHACV